MGGRGRGRNALSFNVESLGFVHGEALPGPCLQPPPAYPILEHHPAPLVLTPSSVIQLSYKVDLLNRLSKEVKSVNYSWDYFPYELRLGIKKRKLASNEVQTKKQTSKDLDELSVIFFFNLFLLIYIFICI